MFSFYAASALSCLHSLVLSLCGRGKLFSGSSGGSTRCVTILHASAMWQRLSLLKASMGKHAGGFSSLCCSGNHQCQEPGGGEVVQVEGLPQALGGLATCSLN